MAIDMFDTRTMLAAIEQMLPPKTFLRDTFFSVTNAFDTEVVDVDIVKGKRRMAPFVSPKLAGKVVDRLGYSTRAYRPPMVNPKMITTSEQLLKRMAGEALYSGVSPDDRAAAQLGRDLTELEDLITRREEWMCAQALFTGKIHMVGEGVDEEIDFDLTNKEALTSGSKWSADGTDPIADLKRWRLAILQGSGINPDITIMSSDVVDAFLNNATVQNKLDLRLVDSGQINPQLLPNGVTYIGRLAEVGTNIYSYDEWYVDDSGDEQPMVPEKTVLMASTNARFSRLYGAYVDAEQGAFAMPRIPRSWAEKDPSQRFVQLISRPIMVPHQVDSLYVATVL